MLKTDQDVLKDGRKNALKDVEVPLRDQILRKLKKKLEDADEGQRTVEVWNKANVDRSRWLTRQKELAFEFDEFIDPIYSASQDWMSTLHLPIAYTICKTYHSRMFAALMGIDPPFTVSARQAANEERAPLVQDLMSYTLKSWVNNYQGIESVVDAWIWRWVTTGSGILKQRWDRKFERFYDVVQREIQVGAVDTVDPQTGQSVTVPQMEMQDIEEEVTEVTFDGPCVEEVPLEDIVIVGGDGDPDRADEVIHSTRMTASELWSLADQEIFDEEAVREVIKSGENTESGQVQNGIKQDRAQAAGLGSIDKDYDTPRYQILERYCKIDCDGSGITSEVIMWVHKETNKILRATYLRRVMKTGLRPFAKIGFHRRIGQDYDVGLPELIYSITKEIDAIHNMRIDIGIQTSLPMGFYRPTNSTSEEILSFGPGQLIPLDNPQTDIYFPNLTGRTAFSNQEEANLLNQIERLTSISEMSLGIVGGQGATRTATGTRALLQEGNANLDIYVRRMNRGWKKVINYLFQSIQEKLPPGFTFRIFGDDGKKYFAEIRSKEEIAGSFDFDLEANSANSNKGVQIEQANTILQLTSNPMDIQLGIITPIERYEAIKNVLQTQGVRDFSRFVRKPTGMMLVLSPEEIANRALAGTDIPLGPEQDLQGFIAWVDYAMNEDEIIGYWTQEQTSRLQKKYLEAQAMMQAMAAQAAQHSNQQQVAINSAMSTGATQPQAVGTSTSNPAASGQ